MIVFLTNYLNIHQLELSLELYKRLGDDFAFISMNGITRERKSMGFEELDYQYPFVIRAYDGSEEKNRAIKLIDSCDILIAGSVEDHLLLPRLKKKQLTLRYCERFFKKGTGLRAFLSAWRHLRPFQKYETLYYLCSSAFTPLDINRYTHFRNKPYKWGYFPERVFYNDVDSLIRAKEPNSILWCGRMIDWKHPEAPIEIARRLKDADVPFTLRVIGNGVMKKEISSLIEDYKVSDSVELLGSLPPQEVRRYMEKSEVYLFTSDRNEGWGAVLNESMNSGCAVVASHEIGSVPYMIRNNENGLIYRNGDLDDLFKMTRELLKDASKRMAISRNAYGTVNCVWNGTEAADRLLTLVDSLKRGVKESPFEDGPCSFAPIIRDNWFQH